MKTEEFEKLREGFMPATDNADDTDNDNEED
jgi:hypothetical protein